MTRSFWFVLWAAVACSGDKNNDTSDVQTEPTDGIDVDSDGFSIEDGDCDDLNASIRPDAVEIPYDGVDQDCSGGSDFDVDGDGFDSADYDGDDCDDDDDSIHPDAIDACDGVDNDCNGVVDDDALSWFPDADLDGFGDAAGEVLSCTQPDGSVADGTDCDDADATTFPGAPDVACDGVDNDCNPVSVAEGGALLDGLAAADLTAALATAGPGAIVTACEGRHEGSGLTITTGLTLVGLGGSSAVTLDGGASGPALSIDTPSQVTVEGLTLTGGTGHAVQSQGGGLWVAGGGRAALVDVVVQGNTAGDGAGIWVGDSGTLELTNCTIRDNTGDDTATPVPFGGGVWMGDDATLIAVGSRIETNHSGSCGGLSMGSNGFVSGGLTIAENTTDLASAGGCLGARSAAEGILVEGNHTDNAVGGLSIEESQLTGVTIRDNEAGLTSGGLATTGACTLTDVDITGNIAFDGGGLTVTFDEGVTVLDGCTVTGNLVTFFTAEGAGAALEQGGKLQSIGTTWSNLPFDISTSNGGITAPAGDFTCEDGGACP